MRVRQVRAGGPEKRDACLDVSAGASQVGAKVGPQTQQTIGTGGGGNGPCSQLHLWEVDRRKISRTARSWPGQELKKSAVIFQAVS